MKKKKYQAAILGLGRIASSLEDDPYREKPATHVGVIKKHPLVELTAGVDIDFMARKKFARRWQCQHVYPSLNVLFKKHPIDILHIATPSHLHLKQLEEALDNHLSLIILEKPIASHLNEYDYAKKIWRKINCSSSHVVVNHERRFSDDYLYLQQKLASKQWGKLESVFGYVYSNSGVKPDEVFIHDGTHLIDVLFFLIGGKVTHLVRRGKNVSNGISHFSFSLNKVPVFLEISGSKKFFHFEIVLNFPCYRIKIGNGFFVVEKATKSRFYQGFLSLEKIKSKAFLETRYFWNMYQQAVSLLENKTKLNRSKFSDALKLFDFLKKSKNV